MPRRSAPPCVRNRAEQDRFSNLSAFREPPPGRLENLPYGWLDVDAAAFLIEVDFAFNQRKNRVVAPEADVAAGTPFGAALPDDDIAGDHRLAAVFLDPQALCAGIAAVASRALPFLVCHDEVLPFV